MQGNVYIEDSQEVPKVFQQGHRFNQINADHYFCNFDFNLENTKI
jgi:hypothetical protein